ncbi:MAG: sigma-70 family RNA polymerase sigma factor [Bacteroidales bacterium]|nr:sigma-70 family RNA polymerase sigma factor [Bacteroidales bacterium]MBN2818173.1 sigma-70 family RNA polymerase sigma factor [Bacteroidales bacterium]
MSDKRFHRIIQNDFKAQKEFYMAYSQKLFLTIYRYVKNEQDAGSIINMGFYKIFKALSDFEYQNEQMLVAWMKKIMINEALTFLRQNSKFTNTALEIIEEPSLDELPSDKLVFEDYLKMVHELPQDLRTVFNLYAIDGFSHKEIAEKLEIKESSSRVYLARARKILQQKILDR